MLHPLSQFWIRLWIYKRANITNVSFVATYKVKTFAIIYSIELKAVIFFFVPVIRKNTIQAK